MTSKDDDDNLLDDSDDDKDLVKVSTKQSLTRLVSSRKKLQKCTVSETTSGAQTAEPSSACLATSTGRQRYEKLEIGNSRLSRNKDKTASTELPKCTLKSVSQPISDIQMEREERLRNAYCQGEDDNILDDSDDDKIILDKKAFQLKKGTGSSATRKNKYNEYDQRRERYDATQTNQHITEVDIQSKTSRRKSDVPVSLDNIIDSDSSESNYDDFDCSENDGNETSTTGGSEGEGEVDDEGDCSSGQIHNASDDNNQAVDSSIRNCNRSYAAPSSSSCIASDSTESASLLVFGPAVTLALEEDDLQNFLYILLNHTTWTGNLGDSSSYSNSLGNSKSSSNSNSKSNSDSDSGSKRYEDTTSFELNNAPYPPSGIQIQGPDTSCASASSHTILTAKGRFLAFLKRSYQVNTVLSPSDSTVTVDFFDLLLFAVEQGAFKCSKLILDIHSHCHSSTSSSNSSSRDAHFLTPKYTHTPGRPQQLPPATTSSESCCYSECLHRAVQKCSVLYCINDLQSIQQPQELQAEEDNILKSQTHNELEFNTCDADYAAILSPPLSAPSLLPPSPPPAISSIPLLTPTPTPTPPPPLPLPVLLLSGSKLKHEIDSIITTNNMISDEIYIRSEKDRKKEVRNSMKKLPKTAIASLFTYALASDSSDILCFICDAFPFYVYGELRGSGIAKKGGAEGMLLCCAVLCCAVLCCAVLCCAVLCCAVLCCCHCEPM